MRLILRLAGLACALSGAAAHATETITYTYDPLGRLTGNASAGTVNNNITHSVTYDAAGNRTNYTVDGYKDAFDDFNTAVNSASINGRVSSGGTIWTSTTGPLMIGSNGDVHGQSANATSTLASIATLTTKYQVSVDLVMKTASSSSFAIAQYSQTGGVASMYAGGYRYSDNKWVIVKRVGSTNTDLTSVSYGATGPSNVTRHVDLRVNNGTITLLVDGLQILTATDSSPLTIPGTGGIWAGSYAQFQTGVHFDNFMIRTSF